MHNLSGLTLLELLITISILVLVVTLGSPAINSIQKNMQLRGAAQSSYFAFQQARVAAITKNIDVTVAIRSGKSWCAALSDNGVCDCAVESECTLDGAEYKVDFVDYRFVEIDKVTFGADSVAVFDANRGLAIGHAGSIVFSDGEKQLKLILSNMGRVRLCSIDSNIGGFETC
ncbi:GspH/FimT family pseudopilin [uncultured Paraglaciecola sp.]|jgi:Tfp pilus assembly protein FimT|uniref:GspH/FimT family pseudopilin n=1 Tax=uncultured Paraglaciecola sp. TaxID=1765024 RepID=UPI0025EB668D|nr:GspH/FimT family pseudopilin [uncultured Paraglaciecola sp.]